MRFALFLLLLFTASPAFAQAEQADLDREAIEILRARCYRCHGGSATGAGLDVLSRQSLYELRGTEELKEAFVVPKNADDSLLWQAIESEYMPLDDSPEATEMTGREREVIKAWIEQGAAFPLREIESPIDSKVAFQSVIKFLDERPFEDRKRYRFFSLANLYNNPEISEQDLRYTRAALAKVLNSLLFKQRSFVELKVVPDTENTLYAIDLQDMDWDRNQNWSMILDHYPYGVQYEYSQDTKLRNLYNELRQSSGTGQPIVRADWFIVYGSQHPLYTQLLELPTDLAGLESRLGVKFRENYEAAKMVRAGFAKSGVSQQNRLIERHEGNNGYVWISYDFKPRRARSDLARFPLGPSYPSNPFEKNAFLHDGGELIFRLPNGMQGYMLVLSDGERLDAPAPSDIVFDPSGVTGSTAILNGISCMNCHARGMISGFRDDVRNSHAVGGPAQLFVEKIYPTQEEMQSIIDDDAESYISAEKKVTAPYLQKQDVGEPVGKVALRYYESVNLATAAIELGLSQSSDLQAAIRTNRDLTGLGLGRFVQDPPSTIQRAVWESVDGLSYWQEIITLVQPGSMPIAPSGLLQIEK